MYRYPVKATDFSMSLTEFSVNCAFLKLPSRWGPNVFVTWKETAFSTLYHKWYFLKQILIKYYQICWWIPFLLFRKEDQVQGLNKGTVWRSRGHKVVWIKEEFNTVSTAQHLQKKKQYEAPQCTWVWVQVQTWNVTSPEYISSSVAPGGFLWTCCTHSKCTFPFAASEEQKLIQVLIVTQPLILQSCRRNLPFFPPRTFANPKKSPKDDGMANSI